MTSCAHARGEGEPSQVSPGGSRAHARMGPTGAHRLADIDDARPAPACSACGPLRHRRSVAVDPSTGRLCIDSPGRAVARTYVLRFRIRTCARTLSDDGSRFATGPRTGRAGAARGRQPHARAVRVESRGWCWVRMLPPTGLPSWRGARASRRGCVSPGSPCTGEILHFDGRACLSWKPCEGRAVLSVAYFGGLVRAYEVRPLLPSPRGLDLTMCHCKSASS